MLALRDHRHDNIIEGQSMETIHAFFSWLNGIVWGIPMIALIIGTGFYLQLRLGFMPIRKVVYGFRMIWKRLL